MGAYDRVGRVRSRCGAGRRGVVPGSGASDGPARAFRLRLARLRDASRMGQMASSSLLLIASQAVTSVLGYVFWLLAARTTLPQTVGEVGALLSLLSLVMLVATAGVTSTLLVELARRSGQDADRLFSATLVLSGATAAALMVLLVAANALLGFWPLLGSPLVAVLAATSLMFSLVASVLDVAALSRGASMLVLVRSAVASLTRLAALSLAVVLSARLSTTLMLALWSASMVASVALLRTPWSKVGLRLSSQGLIRELRWLLGRIRHNQVGGLAARTPPLVLPLLVTWQAGAEANAGFFLAWQLAGGAFMVSGSVSQAFLAQAGDGVDIAARTRRAARIMLVLGVPALLGVALLGPLVLSFLGEVYAAATTTLLVLVMAAPASAAVSLVTSRLRAERADAPAAWLNVASSVFAVTLAWWWLPAAGPVGASAGYAASQVFGAVSGVWLLRSRAYRASGL